MITRNILAAILATTIAAPLAAQTLAQGEVQIAAEVGVEAGMYSLEQLTRLASLQGDDSVTAKQTIQFILDNPEGPTAMAVGRAATGVSASNAQLAAILGVEPGMYSLEQLARLEGLSHDDDQAAAQTRAFILANPEGPMAAEMFAEMEGVTLGDRQLAMIAGVETGMYSREQLTRLNELQGDGDAAAQQTVKFILDNPEGPLASKS